MPIGTTSGNMFIRSLRMNAGTNLCSSGHDCPDILELDGGDFAIIGTDITAAAAGKLPHGSGCGPDERVVRIPRKLLVDVRAEIPVRA